MTAGRIVHIIEDDPSVAASLALLLQNAGLHARRYASAKEFLKSESRAGCVVADIHMPEMGGFELLEEMNRRRISLPVILTTAFANVPLAVRALKLGAVDFIEKPFNNELMVSSVRVALLRA
jgi:two-component system response regulator FixJ